MRKIKELEERIDKLERLERCNMKIKMKNDDLFWEELDNIKAKQKEQEEFLDGIVVPFIAENILGVLENELQNYAKFISNTLKSLNNKNTETTPKRKVGRPRKETK